MYFIPDFAMFSYDYVADVEVPRSIDFNKLIISVLQVTKRYRPMDRQTSVNLQWQYCAMHYFSLRGKKRIKSRRRLIILSSSYSASLSSSLSSPTLSLLTQCWAYGRSNFDGQWCKVSLDTAAGAVVLAVLETCSIYGGH